jgi:CheY-like chemotaxis protein
MVEAVPSLYWILGNSASPPWLKDAARAAIVYFTRIPADRLPPPRAALAAEAERYYQHKVPFLDPKAVVVWRWDNDRVTQGFKDKPTIPATKAEEYYATRYATQALALDPAYEPAQLVLASLILDKNYEEIGPAKSLAELRPGVYQMLSALNPDLMTSVLDRALRDKRPNVILGALRILGNQGEVRLNVPRDVAQPPLVRALNYPDPRVQLVAAETQLKVPGPVDPATAVRVVDILRRALAADSINKPTPRVMVGYFDDNRATYVAGQLRQIGFEPVVVSSGRAGMRRLQVASDIDAILMDADLPDPGLQNVLGQLKVDRNARALPVLLTAEPRSFERWRQYLEKNPQARLFPVATTEDLQVLKIMLQDALDVPEHRPLAPEEVQDHAERAIRMLARLARREISCYDVRPAEAAVYDVLRSNKLSVEGQLAAITVIGTLPGTRQQAELLGALISTAHPKEVRIAAAETLVKHLQQFGLVLKPAQTAPVVLLAADPKLDPALRSAVTALVGALNPSMRLSGERLQGYRPDITPPMPMPPMPPMPPKDK